MLGELMNPEGRPGKPPSRGKKKYPAFACNLITILQSRREFSLDYR